MDRDQSPSQQRDLTVLVATTNPHKLQEIRDILSDTGLQIVGLDALVSPPPPPDEPGDTFEENAAHKAVYYAASSGLPTIADDSGLVVDALGGQPGVHSARWMGEDTPYSVKNRKLLELLRDVPLERRTARFVCVAALARPDGRVETVRGVHEGRIHDDVRGAGGFGYDPVFYSSEAGETFGMLAAREKNRTSHRGRAMDGLKNLLERL